MGRWFLTVLSAALTVILGVATSIAALDQSLQQYAHPSQIIVIVVGTAFTIVTVFLNRPPKPNPPPFDEVALDNLEYSVQEAEQITQLDPGLEQEENWADKLARWESAGRSLCAISVQLSEKNDWECEVVNEKAAQKFLRLIIAIVPTMLQRGWKENLKKITPLAYGVAMRLHQEDNAANLAYGIARAYHDLRDYEKAEQWVKLMGKNKQTHPKPPQYSELQLRFLIMKGLLAKVHNNTQEEQESFNQALHIATALKKSAKAKNMQLRLSAMIGTIQVRLAELEEANDLDSAVGKYQEALTSTSDAEVQLESYNRLGFIAVASSNYDEGYNYHKQQLEVSKKSSAQWKSIAHEGMAKARLKKALFGLDPANQDYEKAKKATLEDAYQHLREALRIQEEEISAANSAKANQLRIDIVAIIDKILPLKP